MRGWRDGMGWDEGGEMGWEGERERGREGEGKRGGVREGERERLWKVHLPISYIHSFIAHIAHIGVLCALCSLLPGSALRASHKV